MTQEEFNDVWEKTHVTGYNTTWINILDKPLLGQSVLIKVRYPNNKIQEFVATRGNWNGATSWYVDYSSINFTDDEILGWMPLPPT